MSKAGNDEAIKNIIISNSHLERGVSNSQIPVEENTYTVYNAVVFDVIMNIIGSQLLHQISKKEEMEYFDEDLVEQTKPPMVVGLLQQNDALSLAEPPVADRDLRIIVRKMDNMGSLSFLIVYLSRRICLKVNQIHLPPMILERVDGHRISFQPFSESEATTCSSSILMICQASIHRPSSNQSPIRFLQGGLAKRWKSLDIPLRTSGVEKSEHHQFKRGQFDSVDYAG